MYKYDLSICLPAIRPSYWKRLYDSTRLACAKHSFEIVFISPYDLPEELEGEDNIKHIKSYATSVRCAQEGSTHCEGRLIAIPADDGYFFPKSFDKAIRVYDKKLDRKDVMVLRYREGKDFNSKEFPMEYWYCRAHPALKGLNIPDHYKHAMQPMMSIEYFKDIGGYDCRFEHLAYAGHDLSCRIQRDGGELVLSPKEVMNADWFQGRTKDHGPIADSHEQVDAPLFKSIQTSQDFSSRKKIDFDNWKQAPEVWSRRWPEGPPDG